MDNPIRNQFWKKVPYVFRPGMSGICDLCKDMILTGKNPNGEGSWASHPESDRHPLHRACSINFVILCERCFRTNELKVAQ